MPPTSISILSNSPADAQSRYTLMELPADLLAIVESSAKISRDLEDQPTTGSKRARTEDEGDGYDDDEAPSASKTRLTINGRYMDDAVLCTYNKTYALRAVSQSNSFLLCKLAAQPAAPTAATVADSGGSFVRLDATLSTTLELLAVPPRLERLSGLLRGGAYEGEEAEKELERLKATGEATTERRYTPKQIRSIVQASEVDLQRGLDERWVLLLDGHYRPVSPTYLRSLLRATLNHLALHSYLPSSAPLQPAIDALQEEGAREEVARAVLTRWFGKLLEEGGEARVQLDTASIAQCIGMGLLAEIKPHSSEPLASFLKRWRSAVGDLLETEVALELLEGHHLLSPAQSALLTSTSHTPPTQVISPYSLNTLPLAPADRFRELFLHRPQWTLPEITPFLRGLVIDGDKKARDGLLLRFARRSVVKVDVPGPGKKGGSKKEVVLYSARVKF